MDRTTSPLTALTLPAAPLFGLVGVLLLPAQPADPAAALAAVAAHAGVWLAANLTLITGQLLLIAAMAVLGGLLRDRASRLGQVGAGLVALSSALHVGVLGFVLATLPIAESGSPAAVAIADGLYSGAAFTVLIVPTLLSTIAGVALIAVAVWRTRIAPRWVPIVLVAAVALDFVEPSGIALFALWTLGLGVIAYRAIATRATTALTWHTAP